MRAGADRVNPIDAAAGRRHPQLRQFEFDSLLPGHATPEPDGRMRHVELATAQADQLFVLRNLTG